MPMIIQRRPCCHICTIMKTLFTSAATANRNLMALIYVIPLKSNGLSQDYAVCLFLKTFCYLLKAQVVILCHNYYLFLVITSWHVFASEGLVFTPVIEVFTSKFSSLVFMFSRIRTKSYICAGTLLYSYHSHSPL